MAFQFALIPLRQPHEQGEFFLEEFSPGNRKRRGTQLLPSASLEKTEHRRFDGIPATAPPAYTSFDNNSSLALCFLSAAMRVSIASTGFKSTIVRRSLRMASMCLPGKSFSSLRVPLLGMSI